MVVPALRPETVPEVPTVATAVALLDHTPPGDASDNAMVVPAHNTLAPVMADVAVTVTVLVTVQPETVYEIAAVPAIMPDTMPAVPTVAMEVAPLVHVPPGVASDNTTVVPAHNVLAPVMGNVPQKASPKM